MAVSIVNDVLGPVMRGPSSSHSAAAWRIGRIARDLAAALPKVVRLRIDRTGSLATTFFSQGSAMGLAGGLLDLEMTAEQFPDALRLARDGGMKLITEVGDFGHQHPNTYDMTLETGSHQVTVSAVSTGGGAIRIERIDGAEVSIDGKCWYTVVWLDTQEIPTFELPKEAAAIAAICETETKGKLLLISSRERLAPDLANSIASLPGIGRISVVRPVFPIVVWQQATADSVPALSDIESARANRPLHKIAYEHETRLLQVGEDQVRAVLREMIDVMRRAITAATVNACWPGRIAPPCAGKLRFSRLKSELRELQYFLPTVAYTAAVLEAKHAMQPIAAAPTAGACGVIPGCLLAVAEAVGRSDRRLEDALAAAGLVGAFAAERWTLSAELAGCQAECGVASAMAAAGVVDLLDGSAQQAMAAASLALQNVIGLVCDPVGDGVEWPCLGRNVMAALNAMGAAMLALHDVPPVIPFSEVLDACNCVGRMLPRELRCTGLGGLSCTPTAKQFSTESK